MSSRKQNIYTDLAIEMQEFLYESTDTGEQIEGLELKSYENAEGSISLTWVSILNESGAQAMGKPIGNYVTIEAPAIKENSLDINENVIRILADNLKKLINIDDNAVVLVVGLGNWNVTPDALGPKVVSQTLVTRHIIEDIPIEIDDTVRPVCAFSPGVMGLTGIETAEIIKGVVDRVKPALVIAIDALAARKTSRINSTIQMADTGVTPGGGMGNKRKALNEKTLGVPVIAIGVPTVVDAATLINDTMDKMLVEMTAAAEKGSNFYKMLQDMDSEEKYRLITEILDPYTENMFVTPKEVDAVIKRISKVISSGINMALHPNADISDISKYL